MDASQGRRILQREQTQDCEEREAPRKPQRARVGNDADGPAPAAGPARPEAVPAGSAQPERGRSTHRSASSGTGRRRCPRSGCEAKPTGHCWRASRSPQPAPQFSTRHSSGTHTLPTSQAHRHASLPQRTSLWEALGRGCVLSSTSGRLTAGKPGRGAAQAARSPHTNVQTCSPSPRQSKGSELTWALPRPLTGSTQPAQFTRSLSLGNAPP